MSRVLIGRFVFVLLSGTVSRTVAVDSRESSVLASVWGYLSSLPRRLPYPKLVSLRVTGLSAVPPSAPCRAAVTSTGARALWTSPQQLRALALLSEECFHSTSDATPLHRPRVSPRVGDPPPLSGRPVCLPQLALRLCVDPAP